MANSIQKIEDFARQMMGPPGPDVEPLELLMRTAALPLAPAILDMLPDDPAVIDQALSELSYSILAMRSDDAPAASIAIEGPSRELHPGDE